MVSIIIPCYNTEGSIANTLESVLNQSCGDWEVIAVDDGSTDNTYSLLEEYSRRDGRIRTVRKPNGGVSSARNAGIDNARGEILYFLDGDDTVREELVARLTEAFRQPVDMAVFGFLEEKSATVTRCHLPKAVGGEEILKRFLTNRSCIHICGCAFRRSFVEVEALRFDEDTAFSEDREFICRALYAVADRMTAIPEVLYTYHFQPGSAMRRRVYDNRKFSSVLASERMYKLLQNTDFRCEALIQLKTVIILHQRSITKRGLPASEVTQKLQRKALEYLPKHSPLCLYRDAAFASVMSRLFRYPALYRFALRHI